MFELDELGEMTWVPLVLLAAVMAWRSRPTLVAGLGEGGRVALRGAPAGLPGWVTDRAGAVLRWARGAGWAGVAPSGNKAFDAHRAEALCKLGDEHREFRAFLGRLHRARDQAEFDAFMAERAR